MEKSFLFKVFTSSSKFILNKKMGFVFCFGWIGINSHGAGKQI